MERQAMSMITVVSGYRTCYDLTYRSSQESHRYSSLFARSC